MTFRSRSSSSMTLRECRLHRSRMRCSLYLPPVLRVVLPAVFIPLVQGRGECVGAVHVGLLDRLVAHPLPRRKVSGLPGPCAPGLVSVCARLDVDLQLPECNSVAVDSVKQLCHASERQASGRGLRLRARGIQAAVDASDRRCHDLEGTMAFCPRRGDRWALAAGRVLGCEPDRAWSAI